jgi:hypothetical protein
MLGNLPHGVVVVVFHVAKTTTVLCMRDGCERSCLEQLPYSLTGECAYDSVAAAALKLSLTITFCIQNIIWHSGALLVCLHLSVPTSPAARQAGSAADGIGQHNLFIPY